MPKKEVSKRGLAIIMGNSSSRVDLSRTDKEEKKTRHNIYIFHAVALLGKNDISLFQSEIDRCGKMLDVFSVAWYNAWYTGRTPAKQKEEEEEIAYKRTKCKPFVILSTTKSKEKYTFVNYGHLHTIESALFANSSNETHTISRYDRQQLKRVRKFIFD